MPTLGPPPLPHPAPASKDVGRSRAPFFPPPRAFLLHQITPRSALLYSLSGASCRGHNTAVKSRLSATTDSTSSVSTPPQPFFCRSAVRYSPLLPYPGAAGPRPAAADHRELPPPPERRHPSPILPPFHPPVVRVSFRCPLLVGQALHHHLVLESAAPVHLVCR
jgi:hypothetical protein